MLARWGGTGATVTAGTPGFVELLFAECLECFSSSGCTQGPVLVMPTHVTDGETEAQDDINMPASPSLGVADPGTPLPSPQQGTWGGLAWAEPAAWGRTRQPQPGGPYGAVGPHPGQGR